MYVKRHTVRRAGRKYVYLRLVEAYRNERGQVRHRVLKTLGREDELKASGQLDQLAASFARLDPPARGARRVVGPLLVVRHYLKRLGLVGIVDALAPMRGRAQLTHGEVIAALVANRLSAPSPLYDVAGWASSHAAAELLRVPAALLNDDRLGRGLEALAGVGEEVRGRLLLAALDRFPVVDATRLHLDLTTVRFAGAYEDTDVFVSMAKLKNHDTCGVTLALKNCFGNTPASIYGDDALADQPGPVGPRCWPSGGRGRHPRPRISALRPADTSTCSAAGRRGCQRRSQRTSSKPPVMPVSVSTESPMRSSNGSALQDSSDAGQERLRPTTPPLAGSIAISHSEQVASPSSGATIV